MKINDLGNESPHSVRCVSLSHGKIITSLVKICSMQYEAIIPALLQKTYKQTKKRPKSGNLGHPTLFESKWKTEVRLVIQGRFQQIYLCCSQTKEFIFSKLRL